MLRAVAVAWLLLVSHAAWSESGEVAVPTGDGPFPGVVVLSSCVGGDASVEWAVWLFEKEHAVLTSGSAGACGAPGRDAEPDGGAVHRARRRLAAHPRVDAERIAVLGVADGALRALRAAHGGGFRAVVAVHPQLPDDRLPSDVPVLMLSGRDASLAASNRVIQAAAAAQRDGQHVELRTLPAANYGVEAGRPLSDLRIRDVRRSDQPEATVQARRQVRRFLAQHLTPGAQVAAATEEAARAGSEPGSE
ncbi:MAG: hypothetical protein QNK03_13125 [Myxococcota bacterium]|nr:hypothetical protein [Myxococcota bacterium]